MIYRTTVLSQEEPAMPHVIPKLAMNEHFSDPPLDNHELEDGKMNGEGFMHGDFEF